MADELTALVEEHRRTGDPIPSEDEWEDLADQSFAAMVFTVETGARKLSGGVVAGCRDCGAGISPGDVCERSYILESGKALYRCETCL